MTSRRVCAVAFGVILSVTAIAQDDPPDDPSDTPPTVPVKVEIDARGRPDGKDLDVPRRFYLWSDTSGWHLRQHATKGRSVEFAGRVTVTDGKFDKLRTIGFDKKGNDSGTVNDTRTQFEFTTTTSGSFDGIDFTIIGLKATLTFELTIAGKKDAKRILIGKGAAHPPQADFIISASTKGPAAKPADDKKTTPAPTTDTE